ncbi:MAG: DNA primase [Desulfobacteraceae bacterium]|nr:DNA primase [Desulfobacteraceae bacterium]
MTVFFSRDEAVQQLKEMVDIVQIVGEHVRLQKSGTNFKGLCPFHSEKSPSFMVNPARRSFHCFGCGEGGDVFTFLMRYNRLTFPEALKELADRYRIELPQAKMSAQDKARVEKRQALYQASEQAAALYHRVLATDPQAEPARRYLRDRAIPEEIVSRFRLGFAPDRWDFLTSQLGRAFPPALLLEAGLVVEKQQGGHYDRFRNRVLCPIHEAAGKPVAFSGRILGEGQPKYLNSPESPIFNKGRLLFGLAQTKDAIRRSSTCLIVEGNFDLLSLVARGVENVIAPLGTALTADQIRVLKGYADHAVLLFDGDAAGLKAAMRAVPLFLGEQLPARVVILPEGHDPDSYVRAHDREGLEELVAKAMPLSDFVFERLAGRHGLGLEGKAKIMAELQPLLKASPDRVQQMLFASHFAQKLGVAPEEMLGDAGRRPSASPLREGKLLDLPLKQKQLLEFLVCYPEYLERLQAAGIEAVLASSAARTILERLRELPAHGGPEQLLETLPPGPERSFVSQLLLAVPSYTETEKEELAAGMIEWLTKAGLRGRKEQLVLQLNQAAQSGDQAHIRHLQEKIREVDRLLSHP